MYNSKLLSKKLRNKFYHNKKLFCVKMNNRNEYECQDLNNNLAKKLKKDGRKMNLCYLHLLPTESLKAQTHHL